MKLLKDKLRYIIYRRMKANRSTRLTITKFEISNFLIAVSTTGMMALGVVPMSLHVLITLAIILIIAGVVGRYIDAIEDDVERLIKYEEHLHKNLNGALPDTSSSECLQLEDIGDKECTSGTGCEGARSSGGKD